VSILPPNCRADPSAISPSSPLDPAVNEQLQQRLGLTQNNDTPCSSSRTQSAPPRPLNWVFVDAFAASHADHLLISCWVIVKMVRPCGPSLCFSATLSNALAVFISFS